MRIATTILSTIFLLVVFGSAVTVGAKPEKVTICHAAGQAGTTKFVTLELPPAGVAAHFTNNGTPKAGHELDYFGPCINDSPSEQPSESPSDEPSEEPSESPRSTPTVNGSGTLGETGSPQLTLPPTDTN